MASKYIFYYLKKGSVDSKVNPQIDVNGEKFTLKIVRPLYFNSGWKSIIHIILWNTLSLFRLKEYQLIDSKGHIASYAQVMPKIFIFGFMKSAGLHLGPCFTDEKHRGKGLYPLLLKIIIAKESNENFYIFTTQQNIASQKGIVKAGFDKFAIGYKSKIGIYKPS